MTNKINVYYQNLKDLPLHLLKKIKRHNSGDLGRMKTNIDICLNKSKYEYDKISCAKVFYILDNKRSIKSWGMLYKVHFAHITWNDIEDKIESNGWSNGDWYVDIFTLTKYRNQGYGTAIVEAIKEYKPKIRINCAYYRTNIYKKVNIKYYD